MKKLLITYILLAVIIVLITTFKPHLSCHKDGDELITNRPLTSEEIDMLNKGVLACD